ncbi:hypothetical protein C3400_17235 [Klebsiella oxytoca]|nr:hypothetical protein C2U46_28970 [Klebsiella oxytoca]MBZ6664904.1 hypothetical protein [Klebsiella michiganensis]MBZ7413759.1 hypothetical protein [Klebsiella michiganensis]MBZ7425606.1 hypothetical protein [Klebsiella michiganensis]MBZ7474773.1 hypothetical protein [Klebsiella michiganensis]
MPGQAQRAASGEGALPDALLRFSSRLALRLAGLRVHNRLRSDSPCKALAPPPGKVLCLKPRCGFSPACAALSRATGSQPSADRVARTGATRRLRGRCAAGCFAAVFFPACAALSRATGSQPSADRLPGQAQRAASVEGALPDALLRFSSRLALRLAGLRVHRRPRIGSPDRRNAPPPGKGLCLKPRCGFSPACAALSRATGSQPSAIG